jgi:hypothetical protein
MTRRLVSGRSKLAFRHALGLDGAHGHPSSDARNPAVATLALSSGIVRAPRSQENKAGRDSQISKIIFSQSYYYKKLSTTSIGSMEEFLYA